MRAVILLALLLLAPIAGAHHLPAAVSYECDVEVGGNLIVRVLDVDIGGCLLVTVDAGYGLGWGLVYWTASVGCGISADLDGNGLVERVDRNAEFPPGTDVYGTCGAGRGGIAKIEISRLVGIWI